MPHLTVCCTALIMPCVCRKSVDITDAYKLLSPTLGVKAASIIFALALLASGQNSTITGTLAGQVVMEGEATPLLLPVSFSQFRSQRVGGRRVAAVGVVWICCMCMG